MAAYLVNHGIWPRSHARIGNVKYDLDPQGDTILVLRNPNAPFAIWPWGDDQESPDILYPTVEPVQSKAQPAASNGNTVSEFQADAMDIDRGRSSATQVTQPQQKTEEVLFRLSSRHLTLASSHFKAMLQGPWKEASDGPPFTVLAEDWDEGALLHVMNIIHGRTRQVPRTIDLELFARIAVIVDYYQCLEAIELYGDIWLNHLKTQTISNAVDRNLVLRMLVSFVFKDPEWFRHTTQAFVLKSRGAFPTLDLPIPQHIVDKLDLARERFINRIMKRFQNVIEIMSKGESGCTYECNSMLLGVLTRHLSTGKLLFPPPQEPFSGYSLSSLIQFVVAIKEPNWVSQFDSHHHHIPEAVKAGVEACIQSEGYYGYRWWELRRDEKYEIIQEIKAQVTTEDTTLINIPNHRCTIAYQFEHTLKKIRKDIRGLKLKDFETLQKKGTRKVLT